MRIKLLLFAGFLLMLFTINACKKQQTQTANSADDNIVNQAMTYYNNANPVPKSTSASNNLRLTTAKIPIWDKAQTIKLSVGPALLVPFQFPSRLYIFNNFGGKKFQALPDITRLLVYKDKTGAIHEEVITSLPDTIRFPNASQPFTGIARVEDLSGNFLRQYHYLKDGTMRKFDFSKAASVQTPPSFPATISTNKASPALSISIDYYAEGYNYAVDDPSGGSYWSEYIGTETIEVPDTPPGGDYYPSGGDYGDAAAAGGGTPSASTSLTLTGGNNIIGNISDYLKCFSNYGGSDHTYQVQVCVAQPTPATRDPWKWTSGGPGGTSAAGNPVDVGHTFLVFSENFTDHAITRNVGFYPQSMVAPWSPADQGQLNDDEGHDYTISLTVTINNAQFFQMLDFVSQGNNPGYMYDLNGNNCTSFALHTLTAGGVSLPSTLGSWIDGGFGNDPGDLGEDIRYMALGSNMSRSTTQTPHSNIGTCY